MTGAKSNCFLGAIAIRRQLGGRLEWRPGWSEPGRGWRGFLSNPWGHFCVRLPDGTTMSYSAIDKNLPVCRQLWFAGRVKRRESV
ncbi:MAG TPA: hypothetical protein EYG51_22235 [Pseudomonadales bacterium]|nr:hypothetical protein [Pseudomonadales bacterium]